MKVFLRKRLAGSSCKVSIRPHYSGADLVEQRDHLNIQDVTLILTNCPQSELHHKSTS